MLYSEFFAAKKTDSKCLLIMLHGLGDSTEGYHWLPEALGLDWMNILLVNAPDEYYGGYSWYDYPGNPVPGIKRSRQMLFELLDDRRRAGFPTEQTILGGFSQGCLMTMDVSLRYPHLFAGLVGISGYVYEPELALKELSPLAKQQRYLVTHGFQDPVIPYDKAHPQFQQLIAAGINIQWHSFMKAHTIAGESEMQIIRKFIEEGYPDAARAGK